MNKKIVLIIVAVVVVIVAFCVWLEIYKQWPVSPYNGCIQVITHAKNPQTGECTMFGNPCVVPEGWEACDGVEPDLGHSTEQTKCTNAGGTWKKFGNGCVDSCVYARNPTTIYCTEALADGCDCGSDKCWNGSGCEKN